jgi:hypothetical protein
MRIRIFVALAFLGAAVACGDAATSGPASTGTGGFDTPSTTGATGSTANASAGSASASGASSAAGSTGTAPPTTPAAAGCSTSSQCQGPGGPGGHCQAPGIDDKGCGGFADIVATTCAADTDCADAGPGPQICVVDPCARVVGSDDDSPVHRCTAGCTTDDECSDPNDNGTRASSTCQAGHCVTPACASAADCLPNFACNAGACSRQPCATDSECSGYCVDGACSTVPGMCSPDAG